MEDVMPFFSHPKHTSQTNTAIEEVYDKQKHNEMKQLLLPDGTLLAARASGLKLIQPWRDWKVVYRDVKGF